LGAVEVAFPGFSPWDTWNFISWDMGPRNGAPITIIKSIHLELVNGISGISWGYVISIHVGLLDIIGIYKLLGKLLYFTNLNSSAIKGDHFPY